MLKHFSVLYAGHVLEGDGIGFDGVPANDRWYSNERCARAFHMSADLAHHMESLGYDILWLAEHHFQREGYECIPNVLLLSLWLAQQTQRLKFGCAFNVLPMWHPLRLAEDFAIVDIRTNGRVIFGMGRGYHTRAWSATSPGVYSSRGGQRRQAPWRKSRLRPGPLARPR